MSGDILKFVCSSVICGGCSSVDFYNGSYQKDVKFIFWKPTWYLILHSCFYMFFTDVK